MSSNPKCMINVLAFIIIINYFKNAFGWNNLTRNSYFKEFKMIDDKNSLFE